MAAVLEKKKTVGTVWFMRRLIFSMIGLSSLLPTFGEAYSQHKAPFCGFNVSGGVGVELPNLGTIGVLNLITPDLQNLEFTVRRRMTTNYIIGGVRAGYNMAFRQCYLFGLAGDAAFGDGNMKFHGMVTELNTNLLLPVEANIKLTNQFALMFKFGRLICNRALVYGLIGPRWGRFSFDFASSYFQAMGVEVSSDLHSHEVGYRTGLLLGLGTEILLTRCISFGLEYSHTNYMNPRVQGVSSPVSVDGVNEPGSSFQIENSFSAYSNEIMIRLGYYF